MAYSAVFEYVLVTKLPEEQIETDGILAVNVALHFCLHVTGIHTFITKEVRNFCPYAYTTVHTGSRRQSHLRNARSWYGSD